MNYGQKREKKEGNAEYQRQTSREKKKQRGEDPEENEKNSSHDKSNRIKADHPLFPIFRLTKSIYPLGYPMIHRTFPPIRVGR